MNRILTKLFDACDRHGEDSGRPTHTVGDLQSMFRSAWDILSVGQKLQSLRKPGLADVIKAGARGGFSAESLIAEIEQHVIEIEFVILSVGYRIMIGDGGFFWETDEDASEDFHAREDAVADAYRHSQAPVVIHATGAAAVKSASDQTTSEEQSVSITDAEYVGNGGGKCPSCGSDQTEGRSIDIDGTISTQRVFCQDCGAEWTDVYKLSGFTDLVIVSDSPDFPTVVLWPTAVGEVSAFRVDDMAAAKGMSTEAFRQACQVDDDLLADATRDVDPIERKQAPIGGSEEGLFHNFKLQYPNAATSSADLVAGASPKSDSAAAKEQPSDQQQQTAEFKVFVLQAEEDIAKFHAGKRPGNVVITHSFQTANELAAYKDGIDAIEDEFDVIDELVVTGCKVTITRGDDVVESQLSTPAEAEAYRQGVDDSDGFHGPLVIDADDDDFDKITDLLASET